MKQILLPSIKVVGLLLALAGSQLRAVAKEPTVDDRFRDAGSKTSEAELPLLNPPQSKLVRENPSWRRHFWPGVLGRDIRRRRSECRRSVRGAGKSGRASGVEAWRRGRDTSGHRH